MTLQDFLKWLLAFSQFSGLLGIVYFFFFVRRWHSLEGIVFYVLFVSFFVDVSNYFFARHIYSNSYIISNIWHLLNYFLVSWIFYKLIPDRRTIILVLLSIFRLGAILSFVFYFSFLDSNTFIRVFSSIVFISLSILSYFDLLKQPNTALIQPSFFWIVTAIFIYSSPTLLNLSLKSQLN